MSNKVAPFEPGNVVRFEKETKGCKYFCERLIIEYFLIEKLCPDRPSRIKQKNFFQGPAT